MYPCIAATLHPCYKPKKGKPMERTKLWYLKKFNFFETMSEGDMEKVSQMVTDSYVKKKQPIFLPGDPSENLYLLKEGRVKITRIDESGKEFTLTLLEPGEIFGELGLFDDAPRETTAVAMEDSVICMMKRQDFENYAANKPELTFKLSKIMGLRLRQIENRIQEMLFRDVPSRLARLILRLIDRHPRETKRGIRLDIKLSQQELANLIGATREMTSSVLNSFKKEGWIAIESKFIYLLNRKALEKIAR